MAHEEENQKKENSKRFRNDAPIQYFLSRKRRKRRNEPEEP